MSICPVHKRHFLRLGSCCSLSMNTKEDTSECNICNTKTLTCNVITVKPKFRGFSFIIFLQGSLISCLALPPSEKPSSWMLDNSIWGKPSLKMSGAISALPHGVSRHGAWLGTGILLLPSSWLCHSTRKKNGIYYMSMDKMFCSCQNPWHSVSQRWGLLNDVIIVSAMK